MRRILFGTLLVLVLSSVGCNQRPERDVPLDSSTDPLFLGPTPPCGSDSVAGWTDCDPKTNRPNRGSRTVSSVNRVRSENTPGIRPNPSTGLASTKDGETSEDPADLEIGVPSWSSDVASEESESLPTNLCPRSGKARTCPHSRRQPPWERQTRRRRVVAVAVVAVEAAALQVGPDLAPSAPEGEEEGRVQANCLFQAATVSQE